MLTAQELTELSERARLIGELQSERIHVALPIDAGSISMLASLDALAGSRLSLWIPIQVITMEASAKGTLRGNEAIGPAGLVIVTVQAGPKVTRTYALTQVEWIVVKMVGLIENVGAETHDRRPTLTACMAAMERAIVPYAIGAGQWRNKLTAALKQSAGSSRAVVQPQK